MPDTHTHSPLLTTHLRPFFSAGILFDKLGSYVLAFQISAAMLIGSGLARLLSWHIARSVKNRGEERAAEGDLVLQ